MNSAVLCQGRVGHTHNRQDASSSHVATVLSKAQTLQDPQAFKERIEFDLMGCHVELLQAAMDFHAWLFPVGTRITGFTQAKEATKQNLEACHSYKLVWREFARKVAIFGRYCSFPFAPATPSQRCNPVLEAIYGFVSAEPETFALHALGTGFAAISQTNARTQPSTLLQ